MIVGSGTGVQGPLGKPVQEQSERLRREALTPELLPKPVRNRWVSPKLEASTPRAGPGCTSLLARFVTTHASVFEARSCCASRGRHRSRASVLELGPAQHSARNFCGSPRHLREGTRTGCANIHDTEFRSRWHSMGDERCDLFFAELSVREQQPMQSRRRTIGVGALPDESQSDRFRHRSRRDVVR